MELPTLATPLELGALGVSPLRAPTIALRSEEEKNSVPSGAGVGWAVADVERRKNERVRTLRK